MNNYQINTLIFFSDNGAEFIDWLAAAGTGKVIIIEDLVKSCVVFLDILLRSEMRSYEAKSKRHGDLTDMLIEIHTIQPKSQFRDQLNHLAHKLFRQGATMDESDA